MHLFERPDDPPTYAHFAFEVDDVVAVYERARELGILDHTSFGYAIAELPGGEAQLYIRDPAGNLLELDHPEGAAARERIEEMILFSGAPPAAGWADPAAVHRRRDGAVVPPHGRRMCRFDTSTDNRGPEGDPCGLVRRAAVSPRRRTFRRRPA